MDLGIPSWAFWFCTVGPLVVALVGVALGEWGASQRCRDRVGKVEFLMYADGVAGGWIVEQRALSDHKYPRAGKLEWRHRDGGCFWASVGGAS